MDIIYNMFSVVELHVCHIRAYATQAYDDFTIAASCVSLCVYPAATTPGRTSNFARGLLIINPWNLNLRLQLGQCRALGSGHHRHSMSSDESSTRGLQWETTEALNESSMGGGGYVKGVLKTTFDWPHMGHVITDHPISSHHHVHVLISC